MITAQELRGVMAMAPAWATPDAGSIDARSTIAVDNLAEGVDRIIKDGVHIVATTGSFGECYNLLPDEFKLMASTTVEVVNKRVPLFIGSTSPNPREVVERMEFIREIGADGTLLGLPYYDTKSAEYIAEFYTQIAERFPELGILIYHNPANHKSTIPVSAFRKIIKSPNIVGMKDGHRSTLVFAELQQIVGSRMSIFVNQNQLYPYVRLGAAGCWSHNVFMGPWPVLYLWELVQEGRDDEALEVLFDVKGPGGGGRPDGADPTGTLPHELAGYVNPGPTRTPIVPFTDRATARVKERVEYWKGLCEKYRPLVEARRVAAANV